MASRGATRSPPRTRSPRWITTPWSTPHPAGSRGRRTGRFPAPPARSSPWSTTPRAARTHAPRARRRCRPRPPDIHQKTFRACAPIRARNPTH
nr:MAG TPA_asm: hypothetical protein [Caudoviricetes sp.]